MKIKKFLFRISFFLFLLPFCLNNIQAQCTDFNDGPYTNLNGVMPGGIAPCDPDCGTAFTITAFEVFSSEAYIFYGVIEGNSYTVDICTGAGANTWDQELTAGPFDGTGISSVDGNIVGNCSLTFTASTSGDYLIVINTSTVCGGATNGINGGNLSVQCNGTASCTPPTCGAVPIVCDPGEDYCSCSSDCPCPTIDIEPIEFVAGDPTISTSGAFSYCADETFIPLASNPSPEKIYIPLGITTTLTCVSEYDISTSHGSLSVSDGTTLNPAATVTSFLVFWLEITDADYTASGGLVTITTTDLTNGPGDCSSTSVVDINMSTNFNTDVATTCPSICTPLTGSQTSFDCQTGMAEFDVTDVGIPPVGYSYELYSVNDATVAPVSVTAVGSYMIGPIDTETSYILGARVTTGGDASCDIQTGSLYPDCYSLNTGCSDLLSTTGDMEGTAWTEVSETTEIATSTTTPTGVPIIDETLPLADAQSAFLGGWGDGLNTSLTSLEQSLVFGSSAEEVNLIFWLLMAGCDSADDLFNITIDGTNVYTTDALSAYPMTTSGAIGNCGDGNWYEITVDLGTTYSDGLNHALIISATEATTNDSNTNFFVDEMILESCSAGIPCPSEFSAANGNRLTGIEYGSVVYETDGILESEQIIDASANVDYDSFLEILLLEGFEVQQGAEFEAFIDGCLNGSTLTENEAIRRFSNSKNMKNLSVNLNAKQSSKNKVIKNNNNLEGKRMFEELRSQR